MVDYLPPGSNELAGAVGKTFDDAIQKAVSFERACYIRLTNPDARPLDFVAVNQLRDLGKA
ncbi:MAG: hypothetical protein GY809_05190 [Planctomycetes bacterium]|nr:hypothetical protein [Planctomycetota bacterium]